MVLGFLPVTKYDVPLEEDSFNYLPGRYVTKPSLHPNLLPITQSLPLYIVLS
jgi:hypothetical protein